MVHVVSKPNHPGVRNAAGSRRGLRESPRGLSETLHLLARRIAPLLQTPFPSRKSEKTSVNLAVLLPSVVSKASVGQLSNAMSPSIRLCMRFERRASATTGWQGHAALVVIDKICHERTPFLQISHPAAVKVDGNMIAICTLEWHFSTEK